MEISINTKEGERVIEMELKGEHQYEIISLLDALSKGDVKALKTMDKVLSEVSGLSVEEINKIPLKEKVKMSDATIAEVIESLDFTKRSHRWANSTVQEKQE